MIPAKKIIDCSYFAQSALLKNLTLGALGKSGFSKGAAIQKSLGTTGLGAHFRAETFNHVSALVRILTSTSQLTVKHYNQYTIDPLIHSGYFYSTSLSPLLLRGTPDYSINTESS